MDLHYLEYITAIADYKNMSRAAESLHISQPALSNYLKSLEKSLNTPLFTRSKNQMVLTSAGEIYVNSCRKILKERDAMYAALKKLKMHALIIAGTKNHINTIFHILDIFRKNNSDISVQPVTMSASDIDSAIKNGTIDFAISPNNLDIDFVNDSQIIYTTLHSYEIELAISSENPVMQHIDASLQLDSEAIEHIKKLHFIEQSFRPEDPKTRSDIRILKEMGIVPAEKVISLNELAYITQAIIYDNAYALFPHSRFHDLRIISLRLPVHYIVEMQVKYSAQRCLDPIDLKFVYTAMEYYRDKQYYYDIPVSPLH